MSASDYIAGRTGQKAAKILGPKGVVPPVMPELKKLSAELGKVEDEIEEDLRFAVQLSQAIVNQIVKLKSEIRKFKTELSKSDIFSGNGGSANKDADTVKKYYENNFKKCDDWLDDTLDNCEKQLDLYKDMRKGD